MALSFVACSEEENSLTLASFGIELGSKSEEIIANYNLECFGKMCGADNLGNTWAGTISELNIVKSGSDVVGVITSYSSGDFAALLGDIKSQHGSPKVNSKSVMTMTSDEYMWNMEGRKITLVKYSGTGINGRPLSKKFTLFVESAL